MLRPARNAQVSSGQIANTPDVIFILVTRSIICFVFCVSDPKDSTILIQFSPALAERRENNAARRSFLFIRIVKFLSFEGPNAAPPPRLTGERASPTRALPVHFCL